MGSRLRNEVENGLRAPRALPVADVGHLRGVGFDPPDDGGHGALGVQRPPGLAAEDRGDRRCGAPQPPGNA
eukprot:7263363-Lingulodinium_polyedra.AAC.1